MVKSTPPSSSLSPFIAAVLWNQLLEPEQPPRSASLNKTLLSCKCYFCLKAFAILHAP